MQYTPHHYQEIATAMIVNHPYCALLLDMGLGKTVSTLTAIDLLLDRIEIARVLIVAPKRVAEHTWPDEIRKVGPPPAPPVLCGGRYGGRAPGSAGPGRGYLM